jgi:P-type Ca2+ transporter type 2C
MTERRTAVSASDPALPWHALTVDRVTDRLDVDVERGLSRADVQDRTQRYGINRLAEKPPRPIWLRVLDQFRSVLILILIAAAVVAGLVGDLKDSLVIGVVVLVNAALGFFQEYRAEAALTALRGMLAPVARVRRDGAVSEVPAAELVPGDLLLLEAGDRVPADARVTLACSAEVSEAALTGESQAVPKTPEPVAPDAPVGDRGGMIFMNTLVTRGRLEAIVVATGMETEMGRLAALLSGTAEAATPLQIQLDQLGKRLALIAGIVVTLIFVMGVARGDDLVTTAMTAIALAVAAIPEGLPAVVTVTLALGMHRMARRHVIVKKLSAVETLGCTTVICSDKTGTLTLNQMTARRIFSRGARFRVSGEGYAAEGLIEHEGAGVAPDLALLLEAAAQCADARIDGGQLVGDPTEGALLALAAKGGLSRQALHADAPRLAEIPFDSTHKFMGTFHGDGEFIRLWLKGAPDVLLGCCTHYLSADGEAPLSESARQAFIDENAAMAGEAMRVLAIAGRCIPVGAFDPAADPMRWAEALTLIGLVGIIDPPRPEAREAIQVCREAGVAVKMITGDHRATAAAVARDLGLEGEVREGRELDGLGAEALGPLIERSAVFARVSPEHKLRIVEVLKDRGHVVAMTGDGVNDAPALRSAHIGIAMGITGTEVTKEASVMVLTDDNFASIVNAVREGRAIYDNIVKFVRFQLSTNVGAILTVLGAPLLGFPTPFTAIQILWVNIIMDGPPAMTLGVDPAREETMRVAPRPTDQGILTGKRFARLLIYGLTMAVGTLGAYAWGERQYGHDYAVTLAFTTFVLFQFFNIFNARAEHGSAFNRQFFSNGKLWLALAGVMLMQIVAVHWAPAQAVFDTVDLTLADWVVATAIASSVLLLEESRKLVQHVAGRVWRGPPETPYGR